MPDHEVRKPRYFVILKNDDVHTFNENFIKVMGRLRAVDRQLEKLRKVLKHPGSP